MGFFFLLSLFYKQFKTMSTMRPCKNQKIISKCYHAFETFNNFENVHILKTELNTATIMLPKFCNEELCFKFFKNDTLIWTVDDIINTLNSYQTNNVQLLKECIRSEERRVGKECR